MANRRNFSRHGGFEDNLHGSPIEPEAEDISTLDELAARCAAQENLATASRSEKIARARALIADPDYPPKSVLNSVANLLAEHLDPNGPS